MVDTPTLARLHPLTSDQRERLAQIQTFLTNVLEPRIADRCFRLGYRAKAHSRGAALYKIAAGLERPFEHFLSEAERVIAEADDVVRGRLERIDGFENHLYPTVRNSIQSEIPAPHRDAVGAALFDGLSQQPLGPAVVTSVRTLLDRLDGMAKQTDIPGLADFFEDLDAKGLGPAAIDAIRIDLAAFDGTPAEAPEGQVPEAEIAAANAAQVEAYDRLNAWYIGWADHLRPRLPYHGAVRLGILQPKGASPKKAAPLEDDSTEA